MNFISQFKKKIDAITKGLTIGFLSVLPLKTTQYTEQNCN